MPHSGSNADFHRHAVIQLKQEYLLQREEINRGLENNMQNKMSCTLLYCINWNEKEWIRWEGLQAVKFTDENVDTCLTEKNA